MRKMTLGCWLALVGGGAAVTVSSAFSQQLPGATPGTQTDDATPRPQGRPATESLLKVTPAPAPTPAAAPDSGLGIVVARFTFSGNTAQASSILAPLLAPYVGKTLTIKQLNDAADAVRRHYRDKGWFLAQAYIPAQTALDGIVEIAVLEGRIDKVTLNVAADAPISAAYATRLCAAYLQAGQVITEVGVERPLLLLRDVPRIDAKSVIEPGSVLGTASLFINVVKDQEAPIVSGTLEFDNFGSSVSGLNRLGGEFNINNPYGLGDQLSLRGFVSNASGNGFGRAGYSLPTGAWGTRLGANVARLNYVLGQQFAALKPNGVADVLSISASQPLMRSKDSNVFAQLIVEKKQLMDRTTTPEAAEKSALKSVRVQLNGDLRDALVGVNVYSVSVMRGNLSIDTSARQLQDLGEAGAHSAGAFNKLIYSVQRLQQFLPGLHGMFSTSGQLSNKNLHSSEKFSVGGMGTVRAFPVGELVGDQGYTASAELRYAVPQLKTDKLDVVATLFYDYGRMTLNHDNTALKNPANTRAISGYGVGVNLGYAERFLLKVAIAWPAIGAIADSGGGRRISAQAVYSY